MGFPDPSDAQLLRCWRHQDCKHCLDEDGCSWCPFVCEPNQTSNKPVSFSTDPIKSWSCVSNNHTIQLLAPAYDEDICPHWAERWEVRTRPLGCQVSTITSLTSIVSIASTLVAVLVISLLVLALRRLRRYHQRQAGGWWKFWKYDWRTRLAPFPFWTKHKDLRPAEQEPLLGE